MSPRFLAVGIATGMHVALGWALFLAAQAGVRHPARAEGAIGQIAAVRIVFFDGAQAAHAFDSDAESGRADTKQTRPAPLPEMGKKGEAHPRSPVAPAMAQAAPSEAVPANTEAQSMADLPNSEVLAYRARLQSHLARYRIYPADARSAGDQGVVLLHFIMSNDGRVTSVWLETTSGVADIDREAIAAVMRAQPLPPLPSGWPQHLDISLPVSFKLG